MTDKHNLLEEFNPTVQGMYEAKCVVSLSIMWLVEEYLALTE